MSKKIVIPQKHFKAVKILEELMSRSKGLSNIKVKSKAEEQCQQNNEVVVNSEETANEVKESDTIGDGSMECVNYVEVEVCADENDQMYIIQDDEEQDASESVEVHVDDGVRQRETEDAVTRIIRHIKVEPGEMQADGVNIIEYQEGDEVPQDFEGLVAQEEGENEAVEDLNEGTIENWVDEDGEPVFIVEEDEEESSHISYVHGEDLGSYQKDIQRVILHGWRSDKDRKEQWGEGQVVLLVVGGGGGDSEESWDKDSVTVKEIEDDSAEQGNEEIEGENQQKHIVFKTAGVRSADQEEQGLRIHEEGEEEDSDNELPIEIRRPYQCEECKKRFKRSYHLKLHMRVHTDERPYACGTCEKVFKTSGSLRTHIRVHGEGKPYVCPLCQRTFRQSSQLNVHMRIHRNEKKHGCTYCPKMFRNSSNLAVHMKTHTGEKPYVCKVCERAFRQTSHLDVHMKVHSEVKNYRCTICNKHFRNNSNLNVHLKTHTGEKNHMCKVCGKAFRQSSHLNVHLKTHTNERKLVCGLCSKSFSSAGYLVAHLKMHSENKYYSCDVCYVKFRSKSALNKHMETRHEIPVLVYECSECGETFVDDESLKLHMESHVANTLYMCGLCDKTFHAASQLQAHFYSHVRMGEKVSFVVTKEIENAVEEEA